MTAKTITPKTVVAILDQLIPCMDPEKIIEVFGERTVIYSDDTQSPALYLELLMLQKDPERIHWLVSVFSSQSNESGAIDHIIDRMPA